MGFISVLCFKYLIVSHKPAYFYQGVLNSLEILYSTFEILKSQRHLEILNILKSLLVNLVDELAVMHP